jgi:hypothetical protein
MSRDTHSTCLCLGSCYRATTQQLLHRPNHLPQTNSRRMRSKRIYIHILYISPPVKSPITMMMSKLFLPKLPTSPLHLSNAPLECTDISVSLPLFSLHFTVSYQYNGGRQNTTKDGRRQGNRLVIATGFSPCRNCCGTAARSARTAPGRRGSRA